jgi:hypothetical protein
MFSFHIDSSSVSHYKTFLSFFCLGLLFKLFPFKFNNSSGKHSVPASNNCGSGDLYLYGKFRAYYFLNLKIVDLQTFEYMGSLIVGLAVDAFSDAFWLSLIIGWNRVIHDCLHYDRFKN